VEKSGGSYLRHVTACNLFRIGLLKKKISTVKSSYSYCGYVRWNATKCNAILVCRKVLSGITVYILKCDF